MNQAQPSKASQPFISNENWSAFGKAMLVLLVIFSLIYMSALSNFSLSIDDESAALRTNADAWVGQGRWTVYFIEQYLVTQPTLVFFPLFLFGVLTSAAYVLLVRAWGVSLGDARPYLLFIIFCAFPTTFFITNFAANLVGLGTGLLASCLCIYGFGAYLTRVNESRRQGLQALLLFAFQVVLASIAVGAYQSLALFLVAGYFAVCLREIIIESRYSMRYILRIHTYAISVILLGALVSEAMGHLLRSLLEQQSSYISSMFRPELLLADPLGVLRRVWTEYCEVYGGAAKVYGFRYLTLPALLIVGATALVADTRVKTWPKRILIFGYLVGMTLIPFGLNFFTGGVVTYRTLVALPLVVCVFSFASVFSTHRVIRSVGFALVVMIGLQSLYTLSLLQTNRRLALANDQQLASRIYARLGTDVPGFSRAETYPIDFYGSIGFDSVYPEIRSSTYSASFFEWDGGNPRRIIDFLRINGYSNLRDVSRTERMSTIPSIISMPIWPAPGSVKFVQGTILVRFSKAPSLAHYDLIKTIERNQFSSSTIYRILESDTAKYRVVHADALQSKDGQLRISAGKDVQIRFSSGQSSLLDCPLLQIQALVDTETREQAQLFYLPRGSKSFSETSSQKVRLSSGDRQVITFIISNPTGFADEFRLDPVRGSQPVTVSNLELQCLSTSE